MRELRNVIERLVILSEESIDVGDLPEEIVAEVARSQREASAAASELPRVELPAEARALPLREFRDHMEREYIRIKLDENGWNISRTATLLGHRAHQPAQEDAGARPVARQPGSRQRARSDAVVNRTLLDHRRDARVLGGAARRVRRSRPAGQAWRRRCSRSTGRACSTTWCTRWPSLAVALAADRLRRPRLVAGLFTAGIAIFSGTLYLLAITGVMKLGAVTPVGGLLLMAGWVALIAEGFAGDLPEHSQSAAEITTSMQVTRPRPASSLR